MPWIRFGVLLMWPLRRARGLGSRSRQGCSSGDGERLAGISSVHVGSEAVALEPAAGAGAVLAVVRLRALRRRVLGGGLIGGHGRTLPTWSSALWAAAV